MVDETEDKKKQEEEKAALEEGKKVKWKLLFSNVPYYHSIYAYLIF